MTGFITPWMAGIGMSGSSLLVVANSLRLAERPAELIADGNALPADPDLRRAGLPDRASPSGGRCATASSTISKGPAYRILMDDDSTSPAADRGADRHAASGAAAAADLRDS
jgi:hypothetical protein